MADSKYYEFVYFYVSPQYFTHFPPLFKTKLEFFEKHGAKIFGRYSCKIGAVGEYLVILEHDNLNKKLSAMKSIIADQEHLKFNEEFSKMVCHMCIYVTKATSFQPVCAPNPNNFLFIRKFDVKANPFEAAHSYKKCNEDLYKKYVEPFGFKIVGYFVPMYGDNCGTFFVIYDMGSDANCLEAPAEILKVISTDKSAQETAKPTFELVHGFSTKIYATA